MEGVVWGSVAGVAFGLFQATNRRALEGVDPYLATFTLIVVSLLMLAGLAAVIEQPSQLLAAPVSAVTAFALAGISNFFLGWTFLALAQQRAGASRTAVIAGTAPLFGTGIAFIVIHESVNPLVLIGVLLVVVGIALMAAGRPDASAHDEPHTVSGLVYALLTAVTWGASAVLARHGLDQVATPLSGVTVGMTASAALYGMALVVRRVRRTTPAPPVDGRSLAALGVPAFFVASALGTQWIAFGLAPVAIVMALNQLAVPVVLLLAPFVIHTPGEALTTQAKVGAGVVIAGTLLIIAARAAAS